MGLAVLGISILLALTATHMSRHVTTAYRSGSRLTSASRLDVPPPPPLSLHNKYKACKNPKKPDNSTMPDLHTRHGRNKPAPQRTPFRRRGDRLRSPVPELRKFSIWHISHRGCPKTNRWIYTYTISFETTPIPVSREFTIHHIHKDRNLY